jgi:sugar lactone lactonase YvrE
VTTRTVAVDFDDLAGAVFVKVGRGCENLYLEPESLRVYVTDRRGNIHLVDGASRAGLRVVKAAALGRSSAFGVAESPYGVLYVAACDGEWQEAGGGIFRVDKELGSATKIAGDFPGLDGLALDGRGNLFFAVSNVSFLDGKGVIYRMKRLRGGGYATRRVFLADRRCVDGVYYAAEKGRVYFTETFSGVSALDAKSTAVEALLGKTSAVEAFDDLCADASGGLWIADSAAGFVKYYDAGRKELTRYKIKGFGRPSSCRVRLEGREEVLYVTEIKKGRGLGGLFSKNYDGRGVAVIPVKALREAEVGE